MKKVIYYNGDQKASDELRLLITILQNMSPEPRLEILGEISRMAAINRMRRKQEKEVQIFRN